MLNISFNELLIVALVMVLLFKPKDYPILLDKIKSLTSQFLDLKDEVLNGKHSFEREFQEIEHDLKSRGKILPEEVKENDK